MSRAGRTMEQSPLLALVADVADALLMSIDVQGCRLKGEVRRPVHLGGGFTVPFGLVIADSAVLPDGVALRLKSEHDLGFLLVAYYGRDVHLELGVLDMARARVKTPLRDASRLKVAQMLWSRPEVRRFRRKGGSCWEPVPLERASAAPAPR
jgi:hypothetical protein